MNDKRKMTAAAAAYILGLSPDVRIKGDATQTSTLREVLDASRGVYLSLRDCTGQSNIAENLEAKSRAAKKFKKVFGYGWPF